jgi:hypothetical protein
MDGPIVAVTPGRTPATVRPNADPRGCVRYGETTTNKPPFRAAVVGSALLASLMVGACGTSMVPALPNVAPVDPPTTAPAAPTASVALDAHAAAISDFVDLVASGELSYRVKYKGQVAASADVLPIAGSLDVAGSDFATTFTYDFDPEYPGLGKKKVQVRGVGDTGWIKRGSGAWKSIKDYGVDDSYLPFKGVKSTADVRYLGSAEVGDATLHKVSIPGSLVIHPGTIPYEVHKEKIDSTKLELLIDDNGRPRSASWHLVGQARVGDGAGQLQRIVYDLDLTFSKVGDEITIQRP